jgi:hypothetical protein
MDQTVDVLEFKLDRIHILADILLTLTVDNPQAQELIDIIMETATLTPEA